MAAQHKPVEPPWPWRLVVEVAVGGLHSIGFVPGTECVLVVSSAGRGLHRADTGERVARDGTLVELVPNRAVLAPEVSVRILTCGFLWPAPMAAVLMWRQRMGGAWWWQNQDACRSWHQTRAPWLSRRDGVVRSCEHSASRSPAAHRCRSGLP